MLANTGPNGEPTAIVPPPPPPRRNYIDLVVVVWLVVRKWLFLVANSNSLRKTTLGKALGSARDYILSRQKSSVSTSGTFVNREEASKE